VLADLVPLFSTAALLLRRGGFAAVALALLGVLATVTLVIAGAGAVFLIGEAPFAAAALACWLVMIGSWVGSTLVLTGPLVVFARALEGPRSLGEAFADARESLLPLLPVVFLGLLAHFALALVIGLLLVALVQLFGTEDGVLALVGVVYAVLAGWVHGRFLLLPAIAVARGASPFSPQVPIWLARATRERPLLAWLPGAPPFLMALALLGPRGAPALVASSNELVSAGAPLAIAGALLASVVLAAAAYGLVGKPHTAALAAGEAGWDDEVTPRPHRAPAAARAASARACTGRRPRAG
jgi:hypothetical protein